MSEPTAALNPDDFDAFLNKASEEVSKWPEWKRNILGRRVASEEIAEEYERRSRPQMTFQECQHPKDKVHAGPRMPLRYGSSETLYCDQCGGYRLLFRKNLPWQPGPGEPYKEDDE